MGQPDYTHIAIVRRVAETFGLDHDPEAEDLYARPIDAGELADWVRRKLHAREEDAVPIQWAPSELEVDELVGSHVKRVIEAVLPSQDEPALDSQLSRILPKKDRVELWERLSRHLGWQLPELAPAWWSSWLWIILGAPYVAGWILLWSKLDAQPRGTRALLLSIPFVFGLLFGLGALLVVAVLIAKRFTQSGSLPEGISRVRDLVKTTPSEKRREFERTLRDERSARIWPTIQRIAAEELGVAPNCIERRTALTDAARVRTSARPNAAGLVGRHRAK